MREYISDTDLLKLKVRPKVNPALEFPDLRSLDPHDPSNKGRFSIEDYWTDRILSKVKSDVQYFTEGDRGVGKTRVSITLAANSATLNAEKNGGHPTDYFNEEMIGIINPDRIAAVKAKRIKYGIKILDDLSVALDSRDALKSENKEHVHLQTVDRPDNNIVLASSPDQLDIDKRARGMYTYRGEASRNVRAFSRGINIIKIKIRKKNRHTGKENFVYLRYSDDYHKNIALTRFVIGPMNPKVEKWVKELNDWYDVERDKEEERLRSGEAKREMEEKKKAAKKEKAEEEKEQKKLSKPRQHAYQCGCDIYHLMDVEGLSEAEAVKRCAIHPQTWKRWKDSGWVSYELCHK